MQLVGAHTPLHSAHFAAFHSIHRYLCLSSLSFAFACVRGWQRKVQAQTDQQATKKSLFFFFFFLLIPLRSLHNAQAAQHAITTTHTSEKKAQNPPSPPTRKHQASGFFGPINVPVWHVCGHTPRLLATRCSWCVLLFACTTAVVTSGLKLVWVHIGGEISNERRH